jgi:hypothetical protein
LRGENGRADAKRRFVATGSFFNLRQNYFGRANKRIRKRIILLATQECSCARSFRSPLNKQEKIMKKLISLMAALAVCVVLIGCGEPDVKPDTTTTPPGETTTTPAPGEATTPPGGETTPAPAPGDTTTPSEAPKDGDEKKE